MRNQVHALFGARLRLGLSSHGMALVRTDWRGRNALLADQALVDGVTQDPHRLVAQCATMLNGSDCAGLPLCVTLDDSWARLFMITPPQNAGGLPDLQAAAAMRFQSLYGEGTGDWQIEADWQAAKPFLACALPRNLLAALQQLALDHKLHLQAVLPQFVAAWNVSRRNLRSDAWLGVVQEQWLTLGVIAHQRLESVRRLAIPADGHSLTWLHEQVTRIALQINVAAPSQLQLTGNVHDYWSAPALPGMITVRNLKHGSKTSVAVSPSVSAAVMLARGMVRT